jgi:hypothetical protein
VTDTLLALCLGLGLAAAAGLRVFLPLLVLGVAGRAELVPLAGGWEWVASPAALIGFGTATALEISGYYVPWVDQLLDVVATPAAVMAGMLATATVLVDLPPLLKYTLVVVGGGGVAGLTQGASVLARLTSTSLTGGLGNPLVATAEWVRCCSRCWPCSCRCWLPCSRSRCSGGSPAGRAAHVGHPLPLNPPPHDHQRPAIPDRPLYRRVRVQRR